SGDANNNSRLDLTETWRFSCAATLTATTTNHARATATFGDVTAQDTDSATVSVPTSAPGIHVVKSASPTSLPAGGGSVTYSYVVTNAGNTSLTNITLDDDRCTTVTYLSGDSNSNAHLDVGETWRYRCITDIVGTTTNTATVSGRFGTVTRSSTRTALSSLLEPRPRRRRASASR